MAVSATDVAVAWSPRTEHACEVHRALGGMGAGCAPRVTTAHSRPDGVSRSQGVCATSMLRMCWAPAHLSPALGLAPPCPLPGSAPPVRCARTPAGTAPPPSPRPRRPARPLCRSATRARVRPGAHTRPPRPAPGSAPARPAPRRPTPRHAPSPRMSSALRARRRGTPARAPRPARRQAGALATQRRRPGALADARHQNRRPLRWWARGARAAGARARACAWVAAGCRLAAAAAAGWAAAGWAVAGCAQVAAGVVAAGRVVAGCMPAAGAADGLVAGG